MPPRRRALLITPTAPATRGNGLAQRSAQWLDGLEGLHERVDTLVVPLSPTSPASLAARRRPSRGLETILDWRSAVQAMACVADFASSLEGDVAAPLDTVVVQRSYLAPLLEPLLLTRAVGRAVRLLDLDDDETTTRQRIAVRLEARGRIAEAKEERRQAARSSRVEARWLAEFSGLAVTSQGDAQVFLESMPHAVVGVVPNVVALPAISDGPRAVSEPITLLLAGNLSYFPNEDAALFLAEEIWPRLTSLVPDVRVIVAGAEPPPSVRALGDLQGWQVVANPRMLDPIYQAADIAVVPVQAGGGTRIKLLEAMAYGLPVVSTALGAEGLRVEHDRHLLIADTPEAFAAECARLAGSADLRQRLARAGRERVADRYAPEDSTMAMRRLLERCRLGPRQGGTPS